MVAMVEICMVVREVVVVRDFLLRENSLSKKGFVGERVLSCFLADVKDYK